jgi:hypothetical protein
MVPAVRRITTTAIGIALLLGPAGAARAQQMDCGGRFVENGATTAQVLEMCGQPQQRVRSEQTLTTGLFDSPASDAVTIPVEVWTYSPPGQFSQRLTFESGRLVKTETGGYADLPPQF